MNITITHRVQLNVSRQELDIIVRGLQMIEWQDNEKSETQAMAIEMKSDIIAIRDRYNNEV